MTVALAGAAVFGVQMGVHALHDSTVTIHIADIRPLDAVKTSPHTFPDRNKMQGELDANCQVPDTVALEKQFRDLNELQEYGGAFTRGVLSYAKAASLYTCYYHSRDYASTYAPETGIVRIDDSGDGAYRMAQDIHATVHGHEFIEGQRANDASWDLYSRIMQKLTAEAVAYTGEFVSAVEMNAHGDSSLVRHEDSVSTDGWAEFKAVYEKTNDIQAAATASVNALLRTPGFVSWHADEAIDSYYGDWAQGRVQMDASQKFTAANAATMGALPGLRLADNVSVPSQQELAAVVPGLARVFDALAPAQQGSPYAQALAAKKAGNSYTARQAVTRVDSDATGKFTYANRGNINHLYDYCSQADYRYSQVPEATRDLWRNEQTLRAGGPLSRGLVDFAERGNLFFCYFTLPQNTAGEWHDDDGIVRVASNFNQSADHILTTQAHETVHGIQRTTGVEAEDRSWTIREYQLMLLSYEAAARVSQYLVALELNDQGNPGPYRAAESEFKGPFSAARDAYENAKSNHLSHTEALQAAGAAGWRAQFADPTWTGFYNDTVLKGFISRVMAGTQLAPHGASYSLEAARKTGWVTDQLNFTATIPALPEYADRFGGNTRMRQAFDYVNLVHIANTLGNDNPAVQQERQRMSDEGNPYFGVDLSIINTTLANPETTLSPIEAMNCFSGISTGCTYGGKPLNAEAYKIKPRAPGV